MLTNSTPNKLQTYLTTEKQRKAKNVAAINTNGNGESAIDPVDIDGDGDDVALVTVLGDDNMDLQTWMQNVCVNVQGKLNPIRQAFHDFFLRTFSN